MSSTVIFDRSNLLKCNGREFIFTFNFNFTPTFELS